MLTARKTARYVRSMGSAVRTRDESKRETREALLAAGIAEFSEHGLDTPSLDGICARAGFTRGAFYVHFKDRDDFTVAVMERVLGAFFDAVIATGNAATDLRHTVQRFAAALAGVASPTQRNGPSLPFRGMVQFHRLLEACARSGALRQRHVQLVEEAIARVAQAISAGQRAGTVRSDVDPRQVATVLAAIASGALAMLESGVTVDTAAASATVLTLLGCRPVVR